MELTIFILTIYIAAMQVVTWLKIDTISEDCINNE